MLPGQSAYTLLGVDPPPPEVIRAEGGKRKAGKCRQPGIRPTFRGLPRPDANGTWRSHPATAWAGACYAKGTPLLVFIRSDPFPGRKGKTSKYHQDFRRWCRKLSIHVLPVGPELARMKEELKDGGPPIYESYLCTGSIDALLELCSKPFVRDARPDCPHPALMRLAEQDWAAADKGFDPVRMSQGAGAEKRVIIRAVGKVLEEACPTDGTAMPAAEKGIFSTPITSPKHPVGPAPQVYVNVADWRNRLKREAKSNPPVGPSQPVNSTAEPVPHKPRD